MQGQGSVSPTAFPRASINAALGLKAEPGTAAALSRTEQEKLVKYYSRVLSMVLHAIDDGSQIPIPSRDYIEHILSSLDWDIGDEWQRLTDDELYAHVVVAYRLKDDMTRSRFLAAHRRRRERLGEWQAVAGNPELIRHRLAASGDDTDKRYSEYQLPIVGVIRDIVAEAPVGSPPRRLHMAVKRHVAEYVESFEGTIKREKKKREHSAESEAKRAATLLDKAYTSESCRHGRASADSLLETYLFSETGIGPVMRDVVEQKIAHRFNLSSSQGASLATIADRPAKRSIERLLKAMAGAPNSADKYADRIDQLADEIELDDVEDGKIRILSSEAPVFPLPEPLDESVKETREPIVVGQNVEDFIAEHFGTKPEAVPVNLPEAVETEPKTDDVLDPGVGSKTSVKPVTDKQRALLLQAKEAGIEFEWPQTCSGATELIKQLIESGALQKLPVTDGQRAVLDKASSKGNVFAYPQTRGEASELIKALLESGAFSDFLSLAEIQQYDPGGGKNQGHNRRYCCPFCRKTITREHRADFAVNVHTGEYHCHVCKKGGVCREYLDDCTADLPTRTFTPAPSPAVSEITDDRWKKWFSESKTILNTPGADYLSGRGVPPDVAAAAGVRFCHWYFDGSVFFPIRNTNNELVAIASRGINNNEKRSRGPKSEGVFMATPGALEAKMLAVVEAPIDALVLAACGLDAIALLGSDCPKWLSDALISKSVLTATDADKAGDEVAEKIAAGLLGWAATVRFRPQGGKDWSEIAEKQGLDAVRRQIADLGLVPGFEQYQKAADETVEVPASLPEPVVDDENLTPTDWECPF